MSDSSVVSAASSIRPSLEEDLREPLQWGEKRSYIQPLCSPNREGLAPAHKTSNDLGPIGFSRLSSYLSPALCLCQTSCNASLSQIFLTFLTWLPLPGIQSYLKLSHSFTKLIHGHLSNLSTEEASSRKYFLSLRIREGVSSVFLQTLIIRGGHSPLLCSYLHWTVSSV